MAGPNQTQPTTVGSAEVFNGANGVNAGDIIYPIQDATRFDVFTFYGGNGALQILVSLDGQNFENVAVQDLSAASVGQTYTATLAAGHVGMLVGSFRSVQVQQSGATATTNAAMVCTKKGGQY